MNDQPKRMPPARGPLVIKTILLNATGDTIVDERRGQVMTLLWDSAKKKVGMVMQLRSRQAGRYCYAVVDEVENPEDRYLGSLDTPNGVKHVIERMVWIDPEEEAKARG